MISLFGSCFSYIFGMGFDKKAQELKTTDLIVFDEGILTANYGMNKSIFEKYSPPRPIVLIGMMGAGKTSVGQALAKLMDIPFHDTDAEIVKIAGCSIPDIFATKGEGEFRRLEKSVIARLLASGVSVLSLGGGAFMDDQTRRAIKEQAVSVWLRVDKNVLYRRVAHSNTRPLLQGEDAQNRLCSLLEQREPVYALADITVACDDASIAINAERIKNALSA